MRDTLENLPTVASVTDPFALQEKLDEQSASIENAPAQLDAAQRRIDEGRAQVAQARAQLPELPADILDQLMPGARAQLEEKTQELDAAQEQLEEQSASFENGQKALALAGQMRTVNPQNTVALVNVALSEDIYAMDAESRATILETFKTLKDSQLEVNFSNELVQDVSEVFGASEVIGLIVALLVLLVLLVTLASVVAAGLPLVVALIGCGIGVGLVFASTSFISMTSTDPVLALMLGLGVGIDYALLILHRFRQGRLDGKDKYAAIAEANGTAGHAVLFAGMTNIIALGALSVTGIPFLSIMGFAGAFAVALVVLVALTLTPALLSLLDTRLLSRHQKTLLAQGRSSEESRAYRFRKSKPRMGRLCDSSPLGDDFCFLNGVGTGYYSCWFSAPRVT